MKKYDYYFTVFKDFESLVNVMNKEYGALGYRIAAVVETDSKMLAVILEKQK